MNKTLGQRIRSLREAKGFTQKHLAKALNCTQKRISKIEQGLIDISYADISQIANCIGITADEITSSINENNEESGHKTQKHINEMIDTFYAHINLHNNTQKEGESMNKYQVSVDYTEDKDLVENSEVLVATIIIEAKTAEEAEQKAHKGVEEGTFEELFDKFAIHVWSVSEDDKLDE